MFATAALGLGTQMALPYAEFGEMVCGYDALAIGSHFCATFTPALKRGLRHDTISPRFASEPEKVMVESCTNRSKRSRVVAAKI